jgi:hypothetical protein
MERTPQGLRGRNPVARTVLGAKSRQARLSGAATPAGTDNRQSTGEVTCRAPMNETADFRRRRTSARPQPCRQDQGGLCRPPFATKTRVKSMVLSIDRGKPTSPAYNGGAPGSSVLRGRGRGCLFIFEPAEEGGTGKVGGFSCGSCATLTTAPPMFRKILPQKIPGHRVFGNPLCWNAPP